MNTQHPAWDEQTFLSPGTRGALHLEPRSSNENTRFEFLGAGESPAIEMVATAPPSSDNSPGSHFPP